jgi:glutamate dehydrogenase
MQDDLSAVLRSVTGAVIAGGGDIRDLATLIGAWQERNRRPLERSAQLLAELRMASTPDAAMLSVVLRELRSLA